MANRKPLISTKSSADILNKLSKQAQTGVLVESNLGNLADFGSAWADLPATTRTALSSEMVSLVTEQLFIQQDYKASFSLVKERVAFSNAVGVVQKNRIKLVEGEDDSATYDPTVGESYDPFTVKGIELQTSYHSNSIAQRYSWTIGERWGASTFLTEADWNSFLAQVDSSIRTSLEIAEESWSLGLLRTSIAHTMSTAANLATAGSAQAINLLALFNEGPNAGNTPLKAKDALTSQDFLRFAVTKMAEVADAMKAYSPLFNEAGWQSHSGNSEIAMLSSFARAAENYLYSDLYHNGNARLPEVTHRITAWQALTKTKGTLPNFDSLSAIKESFTSSYTKKTVAVDTSGVLAHIYSPQRMGIFQLSSVTRSIGNPMILATNFFTHINGQAIVDPFEHAVTFYVKDPA